MAKTWVNFKEVRQKLNFDLVLSHFDLPAGKGHDFKIKCPFHDDNKPSCSVNTKKNVFHCFSCGAKGNTLDFVTLMNGGDTAKCEDVRKGALLSLEILGDSPKKEKKKGLAKKSKNADAQTKSETVSKKKQGKRAKKKKGSQKASKEPSAAFGKRSGYAKDSDAAKPAELVPLTFQLKVNPSHAFMRDRGISTEIAERHGIGYCNRGMMKGRICFPLRDASGHIVAYSGRYVDTAGEIPEDVSRYKLPKGFPKQHVLFNYDRMLARMNNHLRYKHVVVVEGFWSAIKFDEAGTPAVACMGSSLSGEQIKLLVEAGAQCVTVIFDGDEAGREGQAKALFDLSKQGLWVRALHLAENMSPDDMTIDQIEHVVSGQYQPENEPLKKAS